ncbi:MAG: diguanylate cyclase, partial [Labilithrix sp.]|nr:diguanylate cyclase [Labilithrix sp.]
MKQHALLHRHPSRANASRESVELDGDLRFVLDHLPVVLWSATPDGRITMCEGRGLTSLGFQPGQLVGSSVFDVARDLPDAQEQLARAFSGEVVAGAMRIRDRWHEYYFAPRRGPDGKLASVIAVSVDITARKQAENDRDRLYRAARRALLGERAARRRATFLAQASRVLAGSLDQDTTLLSIAHLVVPEIADGCIVDIVDHVHPRRPVVAYRDPEREAELVEIAERVSRGASASRGKLLAGGEPVFHPRLDSPELAEALEPAVRRDLLEVMHTVSIASVPMRARGRVLGVLSLFTVTE